MSWWLWVLLYVVAMGGGTVAWYVLWSTLDTVRAMHRRWRELEVAR